jgi:hypothetical protein
MLWKKEKWKENEAFGDGQLGSKAFLRGLEAR